MGDMYEKIRNGQDLGLRDTIRNLAGVVGTINQVLSYFDISLSAVARIKAYEQTFESGTSDLIASGVTQTVQDSMVYAGTYALQVTVPAGSTGYVQTPTCPISANQQVMFSFAHLEDENITDVKLAVVWYSANLREIETVVFTLTPSASWQADSRTVSAPKRSAYMALRMQATASETADGNVFLDDMYMHIVGQIFAVDQGGNLKVVDEALLTLLQTNFDTALSTRAPKDEGETVIISTNADISGGTVVPLKNYKRWTLFLKAGGTVDVTVELSPDGGATWFEIPESPVSFSSTGDDVIEFGYDATHIRLTASGTVPITSMIRGVF